MKELDRKNDEIGYEHPEIAWTIIGSTIGISIFILIFWLGFICGTRM